MTVIALRGPTDDEELTRRARRGDARAHRLLVRRQAPRVLELTRLASGSRPNVSALAARALAVGLADSAPLDIALTRAVVHVTGAQLDKSSLASLVIFLTDVEGRSESTVADLLGRDVADIADLRATGRHTLDLPADRGRHCRGWPLATARDSVTGAERSAAEGHLRVCRSCAARLRERDRARQRLIARSAAMTGAVTEVVALTLGTGGTAFGASGGALAGLASSKAAAALGVAAVGMAALSGTVAGTRLQHHVRPAVERPDTRPAHESAQLPSTHARPSPHRHDSTGTSTKTGSKHEQRAAHPTPARTPTPTPTVVPAGILPSLPVQVPDLPRLPTRLPLPKLPPLPTAAPLPTSLRLPPLL